MISPYDAQTSLLELAERLLVQDTTTANTDSLVIVLCKRLAELTQRVREIEDIHDVPKAEHIDPRSAI